MPSPVPAGYTRGPIFFLGPASRAAANDTLLQRVWNEAGAYGSRLVVIGIGSAGRATAGEAADRFEVWESDQVERVSLQQRADALALDLATLERMAQATGVIVAGASALQLASVLGGTPLAQTIRRMNARSKVVCALGSGAAVLCQHMAVGPQAAGDGALPLVHRSQVHFAPGLGLVNRTVIDLPASPGGAFSLARLLTAVAYNPFLVGVGVESDTGVVIYPNTTLEAFGLRSALVIDGQMVSHADIGDEGDSGDAPGAASVMGLTVHVLTSGCTFNFDSHAATAPAEAEAPLRDAVSKSAF